MFFFTREEFIISFYKSGKQIQKYPPELVPCWHQTSGLQTPQPEATSTKENIWMPYKVKEQVQTSTPREFI